MSYPVLILCFFSLDDAIWTHTGLFGLSICCQIPNSRFVISASYHSTREDRRLSESEELARRASEKALKTFRILKLLEQQRWFSKNLTFLKKSMPTFGVRCTNLYIIICPRKCSVWLTKNLTFLKKKYAHCTHLWGKMYKFVHQNLPQKMFRNSFERNFNSIIQENWPIQPIKRHSYFSQQRTSRMWPEKLAIPCNISLTCSLSLWEKRFFVSGTRPPLSVFKLFFHVAHWLGHFSQK